MDPTAPIDSITCRNKGAFVMQCHVKWRVGEGPITPSDYSPEMNTRLDLNGCHAPRRGGDDSLEDPPKGDAAPVRARPGVYNPYAATNGDQLMQVWSARAMARHN
jgi:hypothetical protein